MTDENDDGDDEALPRADHEVEVQVPPHDDSSAAASSRPVALGAVSRRTAAVMTAVGVLLGGGVGAGGTYFAMRRKPRKPRKPMAPAFVPLADHSPTKGPAPAKVTIVEFSDFQCPYCARGNQRMIEVMRSHPEVRLIMRHNPLRFHPEARPAAHAMQAANRQDATKAWALHDLMFENRKALSDADLRRYAERVGLDVATFDRDRATDDVAAEVEADQALAKKVGATGTPAFFINGVGLRGAQPLAKFEAIVDAELTAVTELLAGGTALPDVYEARAKHHVTGQKT
ncbi:MAG: DsbA family protein [Myxococcota bacterium]